MVEKLNGRMFENLTFWAWTYFFGQNPVTPGTPEYLTSVTDLRIGQIGRGLGPCATPSVDNSLLT